MNSIQNGHTQAGYLYQPGHITSRTRSLYFSQPVRASHHIVYRFARVASVAALRPCSTRGDEMSSPQSSNAAPATDQQRQDAAQLEQFGYRQELHRTMSTFSNFAVTFSYISVTTGIFALFAV